jgi:hypothetical protein
LVKNTKFDYDDWNMFQKVIKFGERTGRHLRHSSASCQLCELTWSLVIKYQDSVQDLNTCKVRVDLLINDKSFRPEGVLIRLEEGDEFQVAETVNVSPAKGTRLFYNIS